MTQPAPGRGGYEAQSYWKERLERDFSLKGVGYKSFGAAFNRWQYKAYIRNLEWVQKRFGLDLGRLSILECGLGTGFFLDYYQGLGNRDFSGVDLTQISVENAQKRFPGGTFRQADLADAGLNLGRQFDVVTAFAVLLHITDDAAFGRAVANLCRHSREWILISDMFSRRRFEQGAKSHNVIRSREEYRAALAAGGFEIAGTVPVFAFLCPPRPGVRWWFYVWSGVLRVLTLTEVTGNLAGAFFYWLDGVLIRWFGVDVSLRVLVARRSRGAGLAQSAT